MAIGKWIPFGQTQSPNPSPTVVAVQPPVISSADAKQFGLENFGNTCYANSVLQALYFCGPFRELLVQYPDPSAPDVGSLPPPALSPPLVPPSNPANTARRKPERKFSISESSPSQSSALSVGPPLATNVPPIPSHPPTLLSALRSLYLHISKHPAERGTVAPRAFIDKLKELNEVFRGSMHQDAHEFLNFLLNKIMEEMEDDRRNGWKGNGSVNGNNPSGEDLSASIATMSSTAAGPTTASTTTTHPPPFQPTVVHRLFEGVLTSETRCLTCETVSSRDESFLDLSIDIEQNSSVTACLRQFSASEMLCQKNKFFCDSCCDLQEAEKRMKIKKLPNVLALHLKRFKYQEDVGKYIKLTYRVAFPFELRLFNTVDDADNPDRLYELFAIVVHIGNGPHHGHYVTIIKARGTWLLFDDDSVDTIKESDIPKYYGESTNGSAYVLYYQAVDMDLAALGLRTQEPASSTDIGSAPAAKPVDVTTVTIYSEQDPASPALPPGLTEEPDSSDKSDSPLPSTPASQPLPLSPNQTPKPPFSPPPNISPSVSPPTVSSPPPQVQASAATPTPTLGGLFSTLRHSASMRVRTNGAGPDHRRSIIDTSVPPVPGLPSPSKARPSLRPATAQPVASTAEASHQAHDALSEPSSPSGFNLSPNGLGKDKTPEKKASGWFKRKSSRLEVSFSGASSSPAKEDSAWARSQTVKDSSSSNRRTSEAAASQIPSAFDTSSSAIPIPTLLKTPASVPSSPVQPRTVYPEHKKSTPDLSPKVRSGKPTRRPSTAGATVGSSSFSRPGSSIPPPLPPLPGSPRSPSGHDRNGHTSEFGARSPSVLQRPSTAGSTMQAPGSLAFSMSNSTSSASIGDSPIPNAGGTKKRATRKLSLTAPMLGFGRSRQRDREVQSPPTAFPSGR